MAVKKEERGVTVLAGMVGSMYLLICAALTAVPGFVAGGAIDVYNHHNFSDGDAKYVLGGLTGLAGAFYWIAYLMRSEPLPEFKYPKS